MMIIHATYVVNWYPPGPGTQHLVKMRIPQPELESFLRALIFNNVPAFDVSVETGGQHAS